MRAQAGATAHLGSCAPQRRERPELVARSLARQAGPPCCSTLKSMSSDRLHRKLLPFSAHTWVGAALLLGIPVCKSSIS